MVTSKATNNTFITRLLAGPSGSQYLANSQTTPTTTMMTSACASVQEANTSIRCCTDELLVSVSNFSLLIPKRFPLNAFATPTAPNASKISPPQVCPAIRATIPMGISRMFSHFLILLFLIFTPKNQCASMGIINNEMIRAAINANVLVNASGPKSLPSAACIVNTGMKLTMVVETAVSMAELTSEAPL